MDAAAAGADELLDELDLSEEVDFSDELEDDELDFSDELEDDESEDDDSELPEAELLAEALEASRLSVR